jgi:hypothetical protein
VIDDQSFLEDEGTLSLLGYDSTAPSTIAAYASKGGPPLHFAVLGDRLFFSASPNDEQTKELMSVPLAGGTLTQGTSAERASGSGHPLIGGEPGHTAEGEAPAGVGPPVAEGEGRSHGTAARTSGVEEGPVDVELEEGRAHGAQGSAGNPREPQESMAIPSLRRR